MSTKSKTQQAIDKAKDLCGNLKMGRDTEELITGIEYVYASERNSNRFKLRYDSFLYLFIGFIVGMLINA